MANRLEFSAKTVDLAVEEACRELNIARDALEHEVISHGSSGIFGLVGVKKARIRVFMAPEPGSAEEGEPGGADSENPENEAGIDSAPLSEADAVPAARENGQAAVQGACLDALKRIVDAIDSAAEIQDETQGSTICYRVSGKDSALLIGKHGQTLEAIQYLVEKIGSRTAGRRVAVEVDVEGYAYKRRKQLKEIAMRQAEKARRTGKPVSIGQMSASDRRIVHLALKQDRSVRTQSTGEGPVRKLLVIPRRSRSTKR